MGKISDAVMAAEQRKEAVHGETEGLVYSSDKAVFLGFEIDYNEVIEISRLAGRMFTTMAGEGTMGLLPLFIAAWTDGLLVGLYAGKDNGPNE